MLRGSLLLASDSCQDSGRLAVSSYVPRALRGTSRISRCASLWPSPAQPFTASYSLPAVSSFCTEQPVEDGSVPDSLTWGDTVQMGRAGSRGPHARPLHFSRELSPPASQNLFSRSRVFPSGVCTRCSPCGTSCFCPPLPAGFLLSNCSPDPAAWAGPPPLAQVTLIITTVFGCAPFPSPRGVHLGWTHRWSSTLHASLAHSRFSVWPDKERCVGTGAGCHFC